MAPIIHLVFFIINALVDLLWWAIVISAILSWLFAFEVINRRNEFVYNVASFLDRITDPILRPFRKIIPAIGGVDISPIIVLLLLRGVQIFILPALEAALIGPFG
ncbi:YggT family protein [Caulobacter sp.]|uniref:YggT family protein n=1 Tax=Caulobacter sp. TaxID=78 RepID=UPI002B482566|nr:YggT family protein [Caulobacter sp.]HJV42859.1 YggT family protein [Caulobacter sp.]